ncbi:hypothetical protein [Desulfosporosinus hippei]|uniref:Uncharacterized protein n=1 Tax=Desulfosporosinus hippei DSM 8344 TaxID=1121419 RepID=A0A1G7T4V2_9FIRM|nr:hypothetical protein [Desulfosporosinus hippei]SDG30326.1 hypothetical protein SAMN05443529_102101 [Desulfosporosinus hippei DSM 8344]
MKKNFFTVVILVVSLTTMVGCGTRVSKDIENTGNVNQPSNIGSDKNPQGADITYVNEKYGFSLVFPGYWQDQYNVEDVHGIGVRIHHKPTWLKNGAGTLFQITVFDKSKDEWNTQVKTAVETIGLWKIYENEKEVLGFSSPTDVQYIPDDKLLSSKYMKMENDVLKIVETFEKLN